MPDGPLVLRDAATACRIAQEQSMADPPATTHGMQSLRGNDAPPGGLRGAGAPPTVVGQQHAQPPVVIGTDADKKADEERIKAAVDEIVQANLDRGATFMGVTIQGGVHKELVKLLQKVEADLQFAPGKGTHGITAIIGFQPRRGPHSFGVALDIDAATNPYVIHEAGEEAYDAELAKTYDRISLFIIGFTSIIPKLGQTQGAAANRDTVFTRLQEESEAMKKYFGMMIRQRELKDYLAGATGDLLFQRVTWPFGPAATPEVPNPRDPKDPKTIDAVTRTMQADWVLLTFAKGPPIEPVALPGSGGGAPIPRTAADFPYPNAKSFKSSKEGGTVDAVFKGRSPLDGFLSLTFDIVKGLTDRGFRWGAGTGFGGAAGDIMHFDYQPLKQAILKEAKDKAP
jgi:hypothetical protein